MSQSALVAEQVRLQTTVWTLWHCHIVVV